MSKLKRVAFILPVLIACVVCYHTEVFAYSPDSSVQQFSVERANLLQRIATEKNRIAHTYEQADARFFGLVDSVAGFVMAQNITPAKQIHYLARLHTFLKNINRSYSEAYLKSGTYLAQLSYYPSLINWDQRDLLQANLRKSPEFSVKAVRFIPNDTVAEDFLTDYLVEHPDDIFRYTEEMDDRPFVLRLLEKAVRTAPETAKQYYIRDNAVNRILGKSKDVYVRKSYEIFARYGMRSRAYMLLDTIVNGSLSIGGADSLASNRDGLFSFLVRRATAPEQSLNHSMLRHLDYHCADVMRKVNEQAFDTPPSFELFSRQTAEEMFVLMSYGFKEVPLPVFQNLYDILRIRVQPNFVSSHLITALDKQKLKTLVIYSSKNQLLEGLLGLVNDEMKEYLLGLGNLQKKETAFPALKSFAKGSDVFAEEKDSETQKVKSSEPKKQQATIPPNQDFVLPAEPEIVIEPVCISLDARTKKFVTLKKNILQTIQQIPSFIDQDYAEEVLSYAAEKEPDELLKKADLFKGKKFGKAILEKCVHQAPVSLKRYMYNPGQPVYYTLQYSTDSVVRKVFEINPKIGYHSKPLLLLDEIMNNKLSAEDAVEISTNPNRLFGAMVKIISRKKFVGKYSINREMRDYSLRFIREINDKIASGAAQPFYSVEAFSSDKLYFLMLYGRDEVFTSTFNGLFQRFMQRLPENNGDVFLRSVNHNQFRDFLSLCSNFGTLEDFLSKFQGDAKQKLMVAYIADLEKKKDDLSTVVLVAEAISNLSDYRLLSLLQTNIKKEYERVTKLNDQFGISIYGVLSSMISGNATVEASWYRQVSKQFQISPVSSLASASLFDQQKICVQQMYFYNDDDGRSSFINFMNTYRNQSAWVIEDRKSYVRVYTKQGMHIEILANKPGEEDGGIQAINAYLKENKLSPSVVIHRGHSFHTETTLEKIPASAKLIFVGSCGGFYKISMALENAPEAHIISTKQIGTKSVNDAMLFALNENIRAGKDIVWNEFWDKMREKLSGNQYFSDYIPPNKNLESIFIRAYYKILGV